jgi:hemerythrin superfamily protein
MATVSEKIAHDHRELEEYYNNIINASDDDTRARWQNQFTWELARHSVAEELVVYPAMEENVPNGKEIAEKDRREHRTVSTEYPGVSHQQIFSTQ